jgi:hypothetical protein
MRLLTALVLSLLLAQSALAWDATGHEAVAAIAWDAMKPSTRAKVTAILNDAQPGDCLHELGAGGDPRAYFLRAATWPDVVRPNDVRDKEGKVIQKDTRPCISFNEPNEHFRDAFWSGTAEAAENVTTLPIDPHNAVERLTSFEPLVACKKAPCGVTPAQRAHDLAWLLHLVGDIHQPLHNASRVTAEEKEKEGDRGGNLFLLKKDEETPSNLHSFWDSILTRSMRRKEGENEIAYVDRVASAIRKAHPRKKLAKAKLESGEFAKWSEEGFALAKQAYPKSLERGGTPSKEYRAKVFSAAKAEVALAGYRLADLLDRMFE